MPLPLATLKGLVPMRYGNAALLSVKLRKSWAYESSARAGVMDAETASYKLSVITGFKAQSGSV